MTHDQVQPLGTQSWWLALVLQYTIVSVCYVDSRVNFTWSARETLCTAARRDSSKTGNCSAFSHKHSQGLTTRAHRVAARLDFSFCQLRAEIGMLCLNFPTR